ncbi:c6 zinc finger domain containing protein [Grosmannia clavigera kw1407]|uniref:C6 zinc finger domain containing protein n=1 Tax=Grosmannia clavigera (strain kw1407 / UAMH 11150) TaxID=655863 RepID=F0XUF2_GROCL|nr:c6 zinc finger domain containing protein [Grosmannia clavigera kw1407]EFW98686.1 c6 zinc finger domain containing protein [Grosmannia clavigera kw1407]
MVGVPGKFKGCETCRMWRVKCDNARPFCKKCVDTGRDCAGYERETVFIVGTQEDGGRCSSHPPRVIKMKKGSSSSQHKGSATSTTSSPGSSSTSPSSSKQPRSSRQTASETSPFPVYDQHGLVPVHPPRPAWDNSITLLGGGIAYTTSIAALETRVHSLLQQTVVEDPDSSSSFVFSAMPHYFPADVQQTLHGSDFQLHSQCMVHLSSPAALGGNTGFGFDSTTADNVCMLLYEIFSALLSRTDTFLLEQEWMDGPWEVHPKAWFDQLLDIVAQVPAILGQTDQIAPHPPTIERRMMAQNLLGKCLRVEHNLHQWRRNIQEGGGVGYGPSVWQSHAGNMDGVMPFTDTIAFRDSTTAIMFVTYWATLVLLYPCIECLYATLFQPVLDALPSTFPDLPPNLYIPDPSKYSANNVMDLSASVCRSLDFALASTVQPDLLTVPLFIVEAYYRDINASSGDGTFELLWCGAFRNRLAIRGQDIANMMQSRQWMDVAQY